MRVHHIQIDSIDRSGARKPLRLANGENHYGGEQWEPNIERLPTLRYDFFGGTFSNQITAPQSQFTASIDELEDFGKLVFADARIQLWRGDLNEYYSGRTQLVDGRVTGEPQVSNGVATFAFAPDDAWLDTPIMNTFTGAGEIEGTSDLEGIIKPRTFGNVRFGSGQLIDEVNLVYMVNDGPVQAVSAVYDRVASLGTGSGDYADWAALVAATVPEGSWATCLALGLVRLGAPPDGRVAFDVSGDNASGYVRLPGAIIQRVAEIAGGVVDQGNVSALDLERPYNLQLQIGSQTTARQLIQSLADSVGAVAGIAWTGSLFVQPLEVLANPSVRLDMDGGHEIPVEAVQALPIGAPFYRLATEAERTFVVYENSEVATGFVLRDQYSATRQYRLNDFVFLADGRGAVYINETPSIGNAPPDAPATSNAYWRIEATADQTEANQVFLDAVAPIGSATIGESARIVIRRGGTDVSTSATFAAGPFPSGLNGSFGTGADLNLLTLTQADNGGNIPVTVTYNGRDYLTVVPVSQGGADGLDGADGLPGADGADGQTSYVHFAYADSADGSTNFTNGAPGSRTYIGVYTDFTVADSSDPADYTWSLIKGADGTNGTPGADGADGSPSYVHIAYADSADGTTDFDLADPTGRDYIGVYTDNTLADSTNPADYTWSLIKGADGADGADGAQGPQGPPRSAGAYSAAVFYELDDLVFAPDGRAFLYINATSTAGQPLPVLPDTVNSYWREISTADNTAGNQITIDEIPPILVTANSSGVTTTDLSAVPRRVTIRQGDTDVSANATFSASTAPGGMAGGFGTGVDANLFTLTQADASGSFPVTVTYSGTIYLAFVKVERTKSEPTQGGGAGNTAQVNDQSWTAISSTSHVQVTDDPMIIQSDANGHLEWGIYAVCDGASGMRVAGLVQYSTDNATWTDAASEILSSVVQTIQGVNIPGYLAGGGTVTTLTPNTDYYVRLTVRMDIRNSATFRDEQFTFEQP